MQKICFMILCSLFPVLIHAQDYEKLDRYFDALESNRRFMGSIAVRQGDSLLYTRNIGYADLEEKSKIDSATRYHIGSVSKIFTAVLILKAVEQGKLRLEDNLKRYFPQIEHAADIHIEDLLRHRSGIPNFTEHPLYLSWNTRYRSRTELLEIIAAGGSDFTPGSASAYSNSNYVLLSFLLEDLYKQSYSRLLSIFITGPLRLHNTYFAGPIDPGKQEAYSYRYQDKWVKETETHSSVTLGAGGLVSTPSDLNRFMRGLFQGKLLSLESLDKMRTLVDGIGMGLFRFPFYEQHAYGHTGAVDGFRSILQYYPEADISYALCSNASNTVLDEITVAVLSTVMHKPYALPDFSNDTLALSDLNPYLGVYTSAEIPLAIRIYRQGDHLLAEGTGQGILELEAAGKYTFRHINTGMYFQFVPGRRQLTLTQAGRHFLFTKDLRKQSPPY